MVGDDAVDAILRLQAEALVDAADGTQAAGQQTGADQLDDPVMSPAQSAARRGVEKGILQLGRVVGRQHDGGLQGDGRIGLVAQARRDMGAIGVA